MGPFCHSDNADKMYRFVDFALSAIGTEFLSFFSVVGKLVLIFFINKLAQSGYFISISF